MGALLGEALYPDFSIEGRELWTPNLLSALMTDCKSLYDKVSAPTSPSSRAAKSAALDVVVLKEHMRRLGTPDSRLGTPGSELPTRDSRLRTAATRLRTRGSRLLSASLKNILRNLNDELRNELRTSLGRVSQRVTLLRFACTLNTIRYKWEV